MLKNCRRRDSSVKYNEIRLDGQVVIVTGASTGIGKATALDFAKKGSKVILACRNLNKAEEAKKEIVEISKNINIVVRHLDLASLTNVRDFANEIISTENHLNILVNNAGIAGISNTKSEDGLELTLQTNHYAHFLLTNLLIGLLKKSAPSRIIHVSSKMHKMGRLDIENMNCEKGAMNMLMLYVNSKLYNVIGSNEFARRLKGSGVTSNCLHPGVVTSTEIYRNFHLQFLVNLAMRPFSKTLEEGVETTIFLAVSDETANLSGKYFRNCKEALPARIALDEEAGKKFWERCCDLVDLKPEERIL